MSSDEEDELPVPKKRKIGGVDISKFQDTIASVDKERDEEDPEFDAEDETFIDSSDFRDGSKDEVSDNIRLYREALQTGQSRTRQSDFLQQLEDRYVNQVDREREENIDLDDGKTFDLSGELIGRRKRVGSGRIIMRDKSRYVPTMNDPKLFLVKVKTGKEREVCLTLTQKYFNFFNNKKKMNLLFLSTFSIDTLNGYIYVEAFKESHVILALQGIDNVFYNSKPKIVPLQQMIQVVDFQAKGVRVKKGQWIRISRGLYKNDLGYVYSVNETRGEALVKLIPRLISESESSKEEESEFGVKRRKRRKRPECKKFNVNDYGVKDLSYKVDSRSGIKFTLYDNKKFHEGFLYKVVNFKSISKEVVQPTLDELQLFGSIDNLSNLIKIKQKFQTDDVVKLIDGDLEGLVGVITSINESDGNCIILPRHKTLKEPMTVSLSDIVKFIDHGDFVKVISGKYEGESGSIVKVKKSTVIIYSSSKNEEFEVFISDVEKSSTMTVSKSYGGYYLHDLVKIDSLDCGVIIAVSNKVFKIMTTSGVVRTLQHSEIQGKKSSITINNRDKNGKRIALMDKVAVLSGPFRGRSGIVRHGWNSYLFLHSHDVLENSGIMCVHQRDVETQGSTHSTRNSLMGGKSGFIVRKRTRNHDLLRKNVRIKRGIYKGLNGIVKMVSGKDKRKMFAHVELHSKFKTVKIPIAYLLRIQNKQTISRPETVTSTPWTARRSFDTPLRPTTPHTTRVGDEVVQTPGHREVWSANAPMTPKRKMEDDDDDDDDDESHEGMKTPARKNVIDDNDDNDNNDGINIKKEPQEENELLKALNEHDSSSINGNINIHTPSVGMSLNNINTSNMMMGNNSIVTPNIMGVSTPNVNVNVQTPMTMNMGVSTPNVQTPMNMNMNVSTPVGITTPMVSTPIVSTPMQFGQMNVNSSGMFNPNNSNPSGNLSTPNISGISTSGSGISTPFMMGSVSTPSIDTMKSNTGRNPFEFGMQQPKRNIRTPFIRTSTPQNQIRNVEQNNNLRRMETISLSDVHWGKKGMIVMVNAKECTILNVSNGTAQVLFTEENEKASVSVNLLKTTIPGRNDDVIIIRGENAGSTGKVFGMNKDEAIVRIKGKNAPAIIGSANLTKFDSNMI